MSECEREIKQTQLYIHKVNVRWERERLCMQMFIRERIRACNGQVDRVDMFIHTSSYSDLNELGQREKQKETRDSLE
jgi:hypothetical protein